MKRVIIPPPGRMHREYCTFSCVARQSVSSGVPFCFSYFPSCPLPANVRRCCPVEGLEALENLVTCHRLPGGAVDIKGVAEALGFAVERADLGLDVIGRVTIDSEAGEKAIATNEHYSDEE